MPASFAILLAMVEADLSTRSYSSHALSFPDLSNLNEYRISTTTGLTCSALTSSFNLSYLHVIGSEYEIHENEGECEQKRLIVRLCSQE